MSNTYYTLPEPQPTKPKGNGGKMILIAVALLIVGMGIGNVSAGLSAPATLTVTSKVATPAPTVTVAGTSTEVVPAACLRALDEADEMIEIFGDTMEIVSDAFGAAAEMDIAGLTRGADKIAEQTDKITASDYPTYANACRAEG